MLNRRFLLLGATALLGGCAARATAVSQQPQTAKSGQPSTLPYSSPGSGWTGAAGSGVTAPTDPARTTFKPVAHFLTVSDQVFAADFTVHVMARAPGGITSVEFFHENPATTTVTASGLNSITKADGTTKKRDTYAITLKWADWSATASRIAHTSGNTGLNIYARVTAGAYKGVTPQQLVIGPLRLIPRPVVNDVIWTVSASGKDSTGTALPNATYPGNTYTTLGAALTALFNLGAAGGGSQQSAWFSMPCSPKIVLAESTTYPISDHSGSYGTLGWTTITPAPGVNAIIARSSAPDYSNANTWPWHIGVAHVEFRQATSNGSLVIDHKNFSYFHTDLGWGGVSTSISQLWLNGCKDTTSCLPATDARGLSSPLFNTYWNNGPFPGLAPHNGQVFDPGMWKTDNVIEFIDCGGSGADPLVDGTIWYQASGNPLDNTVCAINTYAYQLDTRFFEPDIHNSIHISYSGSHTITIEKGVTRGANDGVNGNGSGYSYANPTVNRIWITVDGALQGSGIALGTYAGDANLTWSQLKASIDALGIAGLTVTVDDTANLWGARYIVGFGSESGFLPQTIANGATVQFTAFPAVHTEWNHIGGSLSIKNVLLWGNAVRASMFGTAVLYNEGGIVDGWIANNAWQVIPGTVPTNPGPLSYGDNVTVVQNWDDSAVVMHANGRTGDSLSQEANNILNQVSGDFTSFVQTLNNNIGLNSGLGVTAYGVGNVSINSSVYSSLFTSYSGGDFRAVAGGTIDNNKTAPLDPYDMFYNVRPPSDWVGPTSSAQSGAHVWPSLP